MFAECSEFPKTNIQRMFLEHSTNICTNHSVNVPQMYMEYSFRTHGKIFEWGSLKIGIPINDDPKSINDRFPQIGILINADPYSMRILIWCGSIFNEFFQKSLVSSVTLNAQIQKPKYFYFESFYLLSFIFLRWIATWTGTHGIIWWKLELTHFVPAVGFDPRLYGFVVWGVIH